MIESILLGISLAAIPGPIFFEVIRRTITKGFLSGALLAVGEFLANLLILLITYFGLYHFLLLKPVKIVLFLLGSIVLFWIGYQAFHVKIKHQAKTDHNSIIVGFCLAILSPLAIFVWISVGGAYLAKYAIVVALVNIILLAFGVMLFFIVMATIVYVAKSKINEKYIILVSKIFGIILILYGLYFLKELIRLSL